MDGGEDEGSIKSSSRIPRGRKTIGKPAPRLRLANPGTWADLIMMDQSKATLGVE
jgi:hypothetical protein